MLGLPHDRAAHLRGRPTEGSPDRRLSRRQRRLILPVKLQDRSSNPVKSRRIDVIAGIRLTLPLGELSLRRFAPSSVLFVRRRNAAFSENARANMSVAPACGPVIADR